MPNRLKKQSNEKGFTAIELIAVMAVIVILVLLAMPKFNARAREAKILQARSDSRVIESSLDKYLINSDVFTHALTIVGGVDLQTVADDGGLVDESGLVRDVSGAVFYVLPDEYINEYLDVSKSSSDKVYLSEDGQILIDIKNGGAIPVIDEKPIEPERHATNEGTDTYSNGYFVINEFGTITKFWKTGKDEENPLPQMRDVIIPETVNGITVKGVGNWSFYNSEITSISLPETVTRIGLGAFALNSLTEINIPGHIREIGALAFQMNNLNSITLNEGLQIIGERPFSSVGESFSELVIPNSLIYIGKDAFAYMNIQKLHLGNSLKGIGWNAFSGNRITTLTIPNNIIVIEGFAFSNSQIQTLIFESPSGLKTIGKFAFGENMIEGPLEIPASVTNIEMASFQSNQITSIAFNEGLELIDEQAFEGNALSGTLSIPSSVIAIGDAAFQGEKPNPDNGKKKNNIKHLVFKKNSKLKKIGNLAFGENPIEGTLEIPDSVKEIGAEAFKKNYLNQVVFLGDTNLEDTSFTMNVYNGEYIWNSIEKGIGVWIPEYIAADGSYEWVQQDSIY